MRRAAGWRVAAVLAALAFVAGPPRPAGAQAIQATPLPPPPGTAKPLTAEPAPTPEPPVVPGQTLPAVPPPPGAPQAQPNQAQPGQTETTPPAGPSGTGPVQPVEPDWVPQTGFVLRALDKITTRVSTLTGKVGETVKFGTLSITVRRCVVRPPDRPIGAAAYLDIADTAPQADPATAFHGWMFSNYPSLAMLQHPTYDITLGGCSP